MDDALHAIAQLNQDYAKHCRTARQVAEYYFDSDRVLRQLLEKVGL